ncbi:MAG: hypothetical protein U0132_00075 [Gemmatimonadaceae bacterium]
MPVNVPVGHPSVFIRKDAYERANLSRSALDARLGLTDEEFRVEGHLVCIGPIFEDEALQQLIAELEGTGLTYFEDFFEFSGNWPDWLALFAVGVSSA